MYLKTVILYYVTNGLLLHQGKNKMKKYFHAQGFTLAEVLITLAIIGVVAAISIPSVISNSQQQEFKTGLRKAVSVLNSAITMNMALDGESPYDNANLFGYLMRHMAVMEKVYMPLKYRVSDGAVPPGDVNQNTASYFMNYAFYTTDGMRFEFNYSGSGGNAKKLHENPNVKVCTKTSFSGSYQAKDWYGNPFTVSSCNGCGAYGLNNNLDKTTKPPCLIMVDVNGDRKPSPKNANCKNQTCA